MNNKLLLFIGPCVIESEQLIEIIAEYLVKEIIPLKDHVSLAFKASFDKANRTSINSYRGPGIDQGLSVLAKIRDKFSLPILTDFHHPQEAESVAKVVDFLQIPAFLCRQTDMIVAGAKACAKYGKTLKIKKGQFLAPYDVKNIIDKAKNFLPLEQILITERGSSFGYNNLIVDMSSFQIIQSFGVKAIYDATHSVQCPGSAGHFTGGKPENIPVLAKAAMAAGANGIFLETHPKPEEALSDKTTSWPLSQIKDLISRLLAIYNLVNADQR